MGKELRSQSWTFDVKFKARDAVFHSQMKHLRKELSIFDELRGFSSGDETLSRMLDIASQTMILPGEIKDAKWAVFHPHSLNINFFCFFFMDCLWVWERFKN